MLGNNEKRVQGEGGRGREEEREGGREEAESVGEGKEGMKGRRRKEERLWECRV